MNDTPGTIMTIDELSDYLRISKSTVYKLVQSGRLPGKKAGRQWRFHKNAIDEWLSAHPQEAVADETHPKKRRR